MASRSKELVRKALVHAFGRALSLCSRPLRPLKGSIMIVAPHPDDETLGCGGVIARHAATGGRVHIVFLTNGEASHPGHPTVSPQQLAKQRPDDAIGALSVLTAGSPPASVRFLGFPDGRL